MAILSPPAVELDHVTFLHEGGRGVADVSLALPSGGVLGLLGPNGAGKSTILALVAGVRRPQQGAVRVRGGPLDTAGRRRLGLLFQETALDPLMSVRETLWLHGRLFGLPTAALRRRIDTLLDTIALAGRAADPIQTLSGGMKRRLELARAVLHQPALLLLDEPTLGLDPESKARLWDLLQQINRDGAALLVATNDVAEAERYCAEVAFVDRGRIVARGAPADLKRGLRHDAVRVEWPDAPADLPATLRAWDGVGAVTAAPPLIHATVDDAAAFVPRLFAFAADGIRAIRIEASTLEDAYFQIVGAPITPNGHTPAPAPEARTASTAPESRA